PVLKVLRANSRLRFARIPSLRRRRFWVAKKGTAVSFGSSNREVEERRKSTRLPRVVLLKIWSQPKDSESSRNCWRSVCPASSCCRRFGTWKLLPLVESVRRRLSFGEGVKSNRVNRCALPPE